MYIDDIDETLQLHQKEFNKVYLPTFKATEIRNWNKYNRDFKIEPYNHLIRKDSFFNQHFYDSLDGENEPYRVLHAPIVIGNQLYTYTAKISLVETEDLIERIALVFILLFTLLLLALLCSTHLFAKKIWHPFHNTLQQLKAFDLSTQQSVTLYPSDIKEFNDLNQSIEKLIDKNISVFTRQKTFIENAAHELQTPLAVLKSKLNLFLQNTNITNEQSHILSAIEHTVSRMSRINKNLLLLAKIENSQFADTSTIEINDTIQETLDLLTDYITNKEIRVTHNITQQLPIICNKTLLEVLISNLFINAIVHNSEKGNIYINLSSNTLTVANNGKNELDKEKIFERFAVLSPTLSNSGLGLSIIKEICVRYQWQLKYSFENNCHLFSIKF